MSYCEFKNIHNTFSWSVEKNSPVTAKKACKERGSTDSDEQRTGSHMDQPPGLHCTLIPRTIPS